MTGLRLAAAVALILAITAEMVIGNPGLGRVIVLRPSPPATASGCTPWSSSTGLLGLLINLVFRFDRAPVAVVAPVRARGGGAVTLYTSTVVAPRQRSRGRGRRIGENILYALGLPVPARW